MLLRGTRPCTTAFLLVPHPRQVVARGAAGGATSSFREPCRASRSGAPANLGETLVGPLERRQVGGVVVIERRIRELHDPPARLRAPCPREQLGVANRVRKADG